MGNEIDEEHIKNDELDRVFNYVNADIAPLDESRYFRSLFENVSEETLSLMQGEMDEKLGNILRICIENTRNKSTTKL
jgi:hypothetical protein